MRERRNLTFDMDNPRHREALILFDVQPGKLKSEYVIGCILQTEQENRLEAVIRKTVSEALVGVSYIPAGNASPKKETKPTEDIADLPEDLRFAMDDGI